MIISIYIISYEELKYFFYRFKIIFSKIKTNFNVNVEFFLKDHV